MQGTYHIKKMDGCDITLPLAMNMAWQVFSEFEAPEYSVEGVEEFQSFIQIDAVKKRIAGGELSLWGCFDTDKIVGVIATRPPCHISLLFVDKAHQKRGIGRRLFEAVVQQYHKEQQPGPLTVHASPYGVPIYRKLGFYATDSEREVNGLRFTPMQYDLGQPN